MLCGIFAPLACNIAGAVINGSAGDITSSATDGIFSAMAEGVNAAVKWAITLLCSWTLLPSTPVCAGTPDGSQQFFTDCNSSTYPAVLLRSYVLPITVLIAVAGIIWQGITMAVSRKGEPLLQVVRGLFTTAVWGVAGIAGSQMLLKASDAYTTWILSQAMFSDSKSHTTQQVTDATSVWMTSLLVIPPGQVAAFVAVLFGVVVLFVVVIQAILMVFREGSIPILAGLLQLAAAGKFTQATSPWLSKVTGWILALATYKVMAATIYATAFAMIGSPDKSGRNWLMGLAILLLSVVAMPAMMKFFNWTVGAVTTHGGGLGMFGGGAAAGLHAASSLRGLGGNSAAEHSRYMDSHGPGSQGPTGSVGPSGPRGPSGPASPGGGSQPPKVIDGQVTSVQSAGAEATASTTASTGTTAAATTGGTTSAATTASVGASAATGPAAPIVAGVVVGAAAATQAAKTAAGKISQATEE
jgi:hypothetical protein